MYKIEFENIGSIIEGNICLKRNFLNVRYGTNGIGKTTISNAIKIFCYGEDKSHLVPYGTTKIPILRKPDDLNSVIIFDQNYVDQYLFKEDIINNSFEIIVDTEEYRELSNGIEDGIKEIIEIGRSQEVTDLESKLKLFVNSIKFNNQGLGNLSKASDFYKASNVGDLDRNIEEITLLQDYKKLFLLENNHEWHKWFTEGENYILNDECPYCIKKLNKQFPDSRNAVETMFNSQGLKKNGEVKTKITDLSKILTVGSALDVFNSLSERELTDEEVEQFRKIHRESDSLLNKVQTIKGLNSAKFVGMKSQALKEYLDTLKINLDIIADEALNQEIKNLNNQIDNLILDYEALHELSSLLTTNIAEAILESENFVNDFLEISGIPYSFEVEGNEGNYVSKIKPLNTDKIIGEERLSYGEKNALSMMLFILEIRNKEFDLIVLDDPVSSFDNNKKYALFHYLFVKEDGVLKNKTTLLFTHDQEVLIDMVYKNSLRKIDQQSKLVYKKEGVLNEKVINSRDLKLSVRYWKQKAENVQKPKLIRIVNARKYFEFYKGKNSYEFNLLSSLEHGKPEPTFFLNGEHVLFEKECLEETTEEISGLINDFSYDVYLSEISNIESLISQYRNADQNLDKIQIMKTIIEFEDENLESVFWDFLTRSYHLENHSLLSVKDGEHELIPEYIIKTCDEIVCGIEER